MDAPSRRLFDEQPQTQKSRIPKDKNVGKQRQLSKRPKLSYNEAVKEHLQEWASLPPRIPYKDTQEYKDRVRREEGHKAANFYQDPLPQRSRPSAPQGNPEEVRRREEEEYDEKMWADIRWRMRGVKPLDPVYHKMKKSPLDAWAADKQVWLRGRENKVPKRREETDRGETTFSIRDLRGMMEEAVEHNADLHSRREEE